MYYENSTNTAIQLIHGDIRDATDQFVVIGRDPILKAHYEQRTRSKFAALSSWLHYFPVQISRASDHNLTVFRTSFRPSSSTRRRPKEINRLQSAIEYPLAETISKCNATQIAMIPISCRAPEVVAAGMIRMIWDISVAAFLHVSGPLKRTQPALNRHSLPFIATLI